MTSSLSGVWDSLGDVDRLRMRGANESLYKRNAERKALEWVLQVSHDLDILETRLSQIKLEATRIGSE